MREPVYGGGNCFFYVCNTFNEMFIFSEATPRESMWSFHGTPWSLLWFLDFWRSNNSRRATSSFQKWNRKHESSKLLAKYDRRHATACCGKPFQVLRICIHFSNIQQPLKIIQPDIVQPVRTAIKLALTFIPGENHYDAVSNQNNDAYVCIMQQTNVTKAGLDVFTVLTPKRKATFTVQNDIYPASAQPLEKPLNEKSLTPTKDANSFGLQQYPNSYEGNTPQKCWILHAPQSNQNA